MHRGVSSPANREERLHHVASYFDVSPGRHQELIAAALENGQDSATNEPGTKRFALIKDVEDPNRSHLNEAYDDAGAFRAHQNGPYFTRLFDVVDKCAERPTELVNGTGSR